MSFLSGIGNFLQNDIVKPVENAGTDIANVWNSQPTWAKGLEIGVPAALAGGALLAPALGAGAGGLGALFGGGEAAAAGGLSDAGVAAGAGDLGSWLGTTDFGPVLGGVQGDIGIPEAAGLTSGTSDLLSAGSGGLGTYEGNVISAANPASGIGSGSGTSSSWLSGLLGSGKGNLLATLGTGAAGLALAPEISKLIGTPGAGNLTQQAQQLQSQAQNLNSNAGPLMSPLTTGVLPQGQQAALDTATNDAITTTKSKYAALGLSGSTMEADAIGNVQQQANAQKVQIEQQLYQSGLQAAQQATSALGLEASLYNDILGYQMQNDQALMKSIAGFAGAVGAAQVKAGT